jgi:hypothetical protein
MEVFAVGVILHEVGVVSVVGEDFLARSHALL